MRRALLEYPASNFKVQCTDGAKVYIGETLRTVKDKHSFATACQSMRAFKAICATGLREYFLRTRL